jgi:hypothetical protein
VVVTVAVVAIAILESLMTLPGLVLSPRVLPGIRLLRCKGTLPAKLFIPLPSIVVSGNAVAIAWRAELNAHSKLLCLRLRRSRQSNRARYQTNCYAL